MCTTDKVLQAARQGDSDTAILESLANRYLPIDSSDDADYPPYKGPLMAFLDEPFSVPEVREALAGLNGRSAPRPDGISNRLLRNLHDESITFLTEDINRVWERGAVPESWKLASVVLVPKPGRAPDLTTLKPISLTSYIGKVAEHAINNPVSKHIENRDVFPYNMISFRPSLSTQDAMKLIKYEIIDRNTRDVRAILGLDLERAFDNVSHAHILDSISDLGLG